MKKLLLSICVLTSLLFGLSMSVEAGDTVNATVTVLQISLNVSDSTVVYGTKAAAFADAIPSPAYVTVANTGNVNEKFSIRGSDTASWTLGNSQGVNQYVHKYSLLADSGFVAMTTSNSQFISGVIPGGDAQVYLRMDLPTSTSASAQQSALVTFVASQ